MLYSDGIFAVRFVLFLEVLTISTKDIPINEQITFKEVRVIDSDGSQLGILPIKDALETAYSKDLDLVNVSPNANPPVCKIMDYGKYRFEIAKREKEARKNQKVIETKEIRLGLSIDKHDFETKGNHAIQFLKSGNKLKVSIRFRGRELGHPEIGLDIMSRFAEYCQEYAVVEKPAKMESRNMLMFLAPKPNK
jgi:translation initiation factor IF-3